MEIPIYSMMIMNGIGIIINSLIGAYMISQLTTMKTEILNDNVDKKLNIKEIIIDSLQIKNNKRERIKIKDYSNSSSGDVSYNTDDSINEEIKIIKKEEAYKNSTNENSEDNKKSYNPFKKRKENKKNTYNLLDLLK